MRRLPLTAAVLAVALVGGMAPDLALAQATDTPTRIPTITVEGRAVRDVVPDLAVITLGVTAEKPSATDAATEAARIVAGLIDDLKASKIDSADIATTEATLSALHERGPNGEEHPKIVGFRATNLVTVKVHALDQAGPLAGRMIGHGANTLQGIDFVVSHPEPTLDVLRAEATRNAIGVAGTYVQAAGVKLGRILEIRPTSGDVSRFRSMAKMDAMPAPVPVSVPLQPGTQTLEAGVSMTWELVQPTP